MLQDDSVTQVNMSTDKNWIYLMQALNALKEYTDINPAMRYEALEKASVKCPLMYIQ